MRRIVDLFPPGQFLRYLCVGAFNTLFGYATYAAALTVLNRALPLRWLSLTVVLASVLATPVNITVAYFGYKLFVFRTHGNYLVEWLKCFAVYGVGMVPGLVALSALTGLLQATMHRHSAALHGALAAAEAHLGGAALAAVQSMANGRAMAGYLAGALAIAASTLYSFLGHKYVTFRKRNLA